MGLRFKRIAIAAILAEIVGVLALVILVIIFGPSDQQQVQEFAENLGVWVGPLSGFVLCLVGGFWAANKSVSPILNGFSMGLAAAILDIGIAVAIDASLAPLLFLSNGGRVIAGTIGGWVASWTNTAGKHQ